MEAVVILGFVVLGTACLLAVVIPLLRGQNVKRVQLPFRMSVDFYDSRSKGRRTRD